MLTALLFFVVAFATIVALVWSGARLLQPEDDPLGERLVELRSAGMLGGASERRNKRDLDIVRLQLLNAKMQSDRLSADEVRAVAAHLMTNLPQVPLVGVAGTFCPCVAPRSVFSPVRLRFSSPRPDPFSPCPISASAQVQALVGDAATPADALAMVSEIAAASTVMDLTRKVGDGARPERRGRVVSSPHHALMPSILYYPPCGGVQSTDMLNPVTEDELYRRGKMANSCVLIMTGKVNAGPACVFPGLPCVPA